jgi:hypothetical protein
VETPAQLALTRELAIGAGQGYLLGRPGTAVDLDTVDIEALLQPSTNPYIRLGLEGFTVEGDTGGLVGASGWQLPVSTSWPGTTTAVRVAGS